MTSTLARLEDVADKPFDFVIIGEWPVSPLRNNVLIRRNFRWWGESAQLARMNAMLKITHPKDGRMCASLSTERRSFSLCRPP